ncbi:excalibur calcium-binding domain-containing protein [Nocardioides lacusdianchii]|uniref:excalibur calcium-binding domain-containing protein n=1 Tax=Nocardioides lacusdianchii TaxID=2783664 RepID=UPI003556A17D
MDHNISDPFDATNDAATDSSAEPATYDSCDEARAAGATPVRIGDLGYGTHLDGDGDGTGCE